jgi:inositol transporter-like SP family MFS transporter
MKESMIWENAVVAEKRAQATQRPRFRDLLNAKHAKSVAFLVAMYGFWNLWAGTNGFFFPYILRTVGAQSQAASVALQAGAFVVAMASIGLVFMPLSDKVNQRSLFIASSLIQIAGMVLLALLPLNTYVAIAYLFLTQFGGGFGAQSFFQLWSAELFPTLLRASAQGLCFSLVRIGLGFWSLVVPILTADDFKTLVWILTTFLALSGIVGALWAPRNEGKALGELEADGLERALKPAGEALMEQGR